MIDLSLEDPRVAEKLAPCGVGPVDQPLALVLGTFCLYLYGPSYKYEADRSPIVQNIILKTHA